MSLQDRIEKFLYGQVMWSGQVADPKREAATIAAMLLDLLRKGPWFDEAVERADAFGQRGLFARGLKKPLRLGLVADLLRAALGEEP